LLISLILTWSRISIISVAASCFYVLFHYCNINKKSILLCSVFVISVFFARYHDPTCIHSSLLSDQSRFSQIKDALKMINGHVLFGLGYGATSLYVHSSSCDYNHFFGTVVITDGPPNEFIFRLMEGGSIELIFSVIFYFLCVKCDAKSNNFLDFGISATWVSLIIYGFGNIVFGGYSSIFDIVNFCVGVLLGVTLMKPSTEPCFNMLKRIE